MSDWFTRIVEYSLVSSTIYDETPKEHDEFERLMQDHTEDLIKGLRDARDELLLWRGKLPEAMKAKEGWTISGTEGPCFLLHTCLGDYEVMYNDGKWYGLGHGFEPEWNVEASDPLTVMRATEGHFAKRRAQLDRERHAEHLLRLEEIAWAVGLDPTQGCHWFPLEALDKVGWVLKTTDGQHRFEGLEVEAPMSASAQALEIVKRGSRV